MIAKLIQLLKPQKCSQRGDSVPGQRPQARETLKRRTRVSSQTSDADCVAPTWKLAVIMWHTRSIAHRRRPPPSIPTLGRQQAVEESRERKHVRREASWEELGGGSTGPTTYPIIQHTTKTGSPGAAGRLAAWALW